jgi:hypothetical protein
MTKIPATKGAAPVLDMPRCEFDGAPFSQMSQLASKHSPINPALANIIGQKRGLIRCFGGPSLMGSS